MPGIFKGWRPPVLGLAAVFLAAAPALAQVPAERLQIIRAAFFDTAKDKDFLADADKAQLDIAAIPGDKLQAMVVDLVATSPDIVEKYKLAVTRQ